MNEWRVGGVCGFVVVGVCGGVERETRMGREKGGKKEKERAKRVVVVLVLCGQERERDRSTHKHKHKLDL